MEKLKEDLLTPTWQIVMALLAPIGGIAYTLNQMKQMKDIKGQLKILRGILGSNEFESYKNKNPQAAAYAEKQIEKLLLSQEKQPGIGVDKIGKGKVPELPKFSPNEEFNTNKKMKNEKEFKKRISEIASKIAEESPNKPEPDANKVNALLQGMSSRLEAPLMAINKASEFKDVIKGMIGMMPNMADSAVRSALNLLLNELSKEKADSNPSEPISKDDPNAAYDGMPLPKGLKESYDRIKKK